MAVDPFRMGRMKRVTGRLGKLKRDAVRMGRLKRRLRRMRRGNLATNSVTGDLEYTSNGPDFAPSLDSILVDIDVSDVQFKILNIFCYF